MANINNFRGVLVYTGSDNTQFANFASSTYNIKDFVLLDIYGTDYDTVANNYLTMAENIYYKRSDARIWIGTPEYSTKRTCTYAQVKEFLSKVKAKFQEKTTSSKIWELCVKGVYMNMETIYGTVDYTSPSTMLNNTSIKLANDVSYYVHNTLKSSSALDFLWIPYYGTGDNAADHIKKLGHVTARTNIFDLVVIQPNYYQDDTVVANLAAIKTSTNNNCVCYRDGVNVTSRLSSATAKIGFEMELTQSLNSRYDKYVSTFNSLKTKAVPICYYAGSNSSLNNSSVLAKIKTFYA